jgi:hypothetical protein
MVTYSIGGVKATKEEVIKYLKEGLERTSTKR